MAYAGWRNVPHVTAINCISARTVILAPTVLRFFLGFPQEKSVFSEEFSVTIFMLSKVRVSFEKRLQSCVASNGAHMSSIIFQIYAKNSLFCSLSLLNNFLVSGVF